VAIESATLRHALRLSIQQSEPEARVLCVHNVVATPLLALLDALALDMDRGAILRTGVQRKQQRSAIFDHTLRSVDDADIALNDASIQALEGSIFPFIVDVLTQLTQELPDNDALRCKGMVPLLTAPIGHSLRQRVRQLFTLHYTPGSKVEKHKDSEARLLTFVFPLTALNREEPIFTYEHPGGEEHSFGYSRGDIIVFRGVDIKHCSLPSPIERSICNFFFTTDEFAKVNK
jgi:hypothetical protein